METRRLSAGRKDIEAAGQLLADGGLVAFPTETVYGLGADATRPEAISELFRAKERPACNPLIVHVTCLDAARELAEFDEISTRLARQFWPGPLTLVLTRSRRSRIASAVSAGGPTLALRVPAHPVALELIGLAGIPVAAPSANRSNMVSPTSADHVLSDLDGRIRAVIDAGPCRFGLESTVIRVSDGSPELLRPGALARETLERHAGIGMRMADSRQGPVSPGRMPVHYAPRTRLRMNACSPGRDEISVRIGEDGVRAEFNLSPDADLEEAAAAFYHVLRSADSMAIRTGASSIAVAPLPDTGLGRVLNERLGRASGTISGPPAVGSRHAGTISGRSPASGKHSGTETQ